MTKLAFDFPDRALFVRLFGGDVYAVGGSVRDRILGRPSPEVDLLVAGRPLETIVARLEKHGRVDLVGKSFGIIKFTRLGRTYDVALPRVDRAAAADVRRHKDIVVAADPGLPVEKDLERRDFRANSMAVRLKDGALIDPFEGRRDTLARRLRLTNPSAFPDDPLRVVRVARFASVLSFRVDPSIYPAARAVDLSGLSVERVNDEMFKLLLDSPRPSVGLEEMFRLGILEQWFPELQALTLAIQDSVFHPERDDYGHHTVWAHIKLTVDQAAALGRRRELPPPRRLALLLAALYHDLGKATTTRWEFKRGRMAVTSAGHDIQSERAARRVLLRFKVQTWNGCPIGRLVPLLIRVHHRAGELWNSREDVTRKAFNRLAADVQGEIELVVLLDAADRAGRGARLVRGLDRQARWLFRKFDQLRVNRETIKPLVMGRDLIALGVPPGPEMGRLLKKLYRAQLDNVFDTKAAGLARARRLLERTAP
ncbi:MAG TPA: HD domain-containing protein [Candidatus Aminicenantes bacterium]|nr:HD domain-containing protein [Candidatus Aminicenantes bacterium]HRY65469.1 HD domain-containing protein [Candidatus Aminicenantes bacterium]HRZ72063.1 HD domain-containing protein [Candidatus Aminicenantes bacterium]